MLGGRHLVYAVTDNDSPTLNVTLVDLDSGASRGAGAARGDVSLSQDGRYLALDVADDPWCGAIEILDLEQADPAASAECAGFASDHLSSVTTGSNGPTVAWRTEDPALDESWPSLAILQSSLLGSAVEVPDADGAGWLSVEGDSVVWAMSGWANSGLTWSEWAGFDLTSAEYRIQ
jgi:hypothetical protein